MFPPTVQKLAAEPVPDQVAGGNDPGTIGTESGTGYAAASGSGSGDSGDSSGGGGSGLGSGSGTETGSNSPPTAQDGYVYTIHDQVATGTFSGQDWDYDLLSISVSSGSLGSLSLGSPYQSPWDSSTTLVDYTFTASPGATGSETLTLTVSDGEYSDDASVYVSVWNTVPEPSDDWAYTIHDQDTSGNVAWNDGLTQNVSNWQDYDGDIVSFTLVGGVNNGTLTLDSATGDFIYEPSTGFVGNDSFTYQLSDGLGTSTYTATVAIAVANSVPEPSNDGPYTIGCNCGSGDPTGNVAGNDGLTQDGNAWKDSDGDTVTFVLVTDVSHGTLTFDTATGEFEYEQNEGYIGDDSFTYQITDGVGTSTTTATVALTVVGKTVPATPPSIQGTLSIDGNATSSAEKGKYTREGETTERETTDEEIVYAKYYFMQYDGPTEFTATYTVNLNDDGTFNPTGSTIKLTTVNYTSRTELTVRDSMTALQQATEEAKGFTVYQEGGKFYILKNPRLVPKDWSTLSIPITEATIVNGRLHSFKFKSDTWYPNLPTKLTDKGIEGAVDLAKCKAEFTSKYSVPTGAIGTYVTKGELN